MVQENGHPQSTAKVVYRLAPGVRWSVETEGLLVSDGKGAVYRLEYPEAAIWDLASRGYLLPKIVQMMCHIAGCDEARAQKQVLSSLARWKQAGLLCEET